MEPGTFRLMKAEVLDLTPELAQTFYSLEPSPTERELDKSRLRHLREKALAKQLITFSWAKARYQDRWIRVNGQHSSQMLVELNDAFPTGLRVHLDEYDVSDSQGLALLFRQFDDRKSGRSSADVAGAYQNIVPELQDVPRQIGKLAVDGITWYRYKIEKDPTTKRGDDAYPLFHDITQHDFIQWMGTIFSMKTPEMRPKGVVAAMYASFNAHPNEARKFWESVARGGDEFNESAPATMLDEWLKAVIETKKKHKGDPLSDAQIYQGCIYAYNGHRKGQPLKSIKFDFKVHPEPVGMAA
jgi:hypothetical protein